MSLEVSAQTLRSLLIARGVDPAAGRDTLLLEARSPRHKLGVTLLSQWEVDGEPLSEAEAAEVAAHRARPAYYAHTWEAISKAAPGAYNIKGPNISSLYPAGVVRVAGDLDVVCPAHSDVWAAATCLIEAGWEVGAFTVTPAWPADGIGHNVMVEMLYPELDALGLPYAVGLLTPDIGTRTDQPPCRLDRSQRSPLATNLTVLLAERWERNYTSRDLLDVALLAGRLSPADTVVFGEHLTRSGLWPEWREAAASVTRLGLPMPVELPAAARMALRARARRAARGLRRWGDPRRAMPFLAQRTIEENTGWFAESVSDFYHERIGAYRAFAAQLPLFGVPLRPGEPVADELRLIRRGRHLIAQCPVGEYLLVGGACKQAWIDEVTAGGGLQRTVGAGPQG